MTVIVMLGIFGIFGWIEWGAAKDIGEWLGVRALWAFIAIVVLTIVLGICSAIGREDIVEGAVLFFVFAVVLAGLMYLGSEGGWRYIKP